MTQFFPLAAENVGSIPAIPNPLIGGLGADTVLIDPVTIQAYQGNLADQINKAAQATGASAQIFLEIDSIADVVIETSVQGASMLQVHVNDPQWWLAVSDFIQVFDDGYLAPLDVTFPPDTKCVWRLCQYHATWDAESGGEGNLILTFEDRIASELRSVGAADKGAVKQGAPSDSLVSFIGKLVNSANQLLGTHIAYTQLVDAQDPNALNPNPAPTPSRPNPGKGKTGPTAAQQQQVQQAIDSVTRALTDIGTLGLSEANGLPYVQTPGQALGVYTGGGPENPIFDSGNPLFP